MTKHCFICGRKENENGCTNKDCPRYEINKPTATASTTTATSENSK